MRTVTLKLALLLLLPALHVGAAQAKGTLDSIRESGVIRLGYLEAAAPFSSGKEGAPAGYSIDLCKRVLESLGQQLKKPGLRAEWVKVTLQNRLEAVKDGRIDLECGTTTWTLSRQEGVDFSLMTFVDGGSLLVKAEQKLARLADFEGKRIAVVKGTTTEPALVRDLKRRKLRATVVPVADEAKGMAMLTANEVDAYGSDRLVLMGLALNAQGSNTFRLIDEDFSLEPYALAMRRDDHDFRLAVNRALADIYRSGEIMNIYNTWLGSLGRPGVLLASIYVLQAIPE